MKALIKNFVSNNPILYTLWFYIIRNNVGVKIKYFSKDTSLYVDGFPRSGNTYLIHLCRKLLPDYNIVHHLHTVAPIKISLKRKIPVFVLVRNPFDAISSRYLKELAMKNVDFNGNVGKTKLNEFILSYINYYDFVFDNRKNINIIKFKDLISKPEDILSKISIIVGDNKDFDAQQINLAMQSFRGSKDTLGSSKPNETKEAFKDIIKENIRESKQIQSLKILEEKLINL